jgi:hypothetical protein
MKEEINLRIEYDLLLNKKLILLAFLYLAFSSIFDIFFIKYVSLSIEFFTM